MSRPAGATTEQNRKAFRSAPLYEAAHILFAARRDQPAAFAAARGRSPPRCSPSLRRRRSASPNSRRLHSACPSAAHGGNLGQIGAGQTTPEFEQALIALAPGAMSRQPVESRYGFHIIRLDRKIEGRELPFELVAGRIADYLREAVTRRAAAQYLARLVSRADIRGVALADAAAHRVN